MKIKIGLNRKSIRNALNTLKTAKKQLQGEMLNEFYTSCYNYFVERANYYLSISDIGETVKQNIKSSWHFEMTESGAKFVNDNDKAVYVEFGVGIVGGGKKHPNSTKTNYEYNVPSNAKQPDGSWYFLTTRDNLDLPSDKADILYDYGDLISVKTYGAKGVWYAFNALEDLRLQVPTIWESIKIKYWG